LAATAVAIQGGLTLGALTQGVSLRAPTTHGLYWALPGMVGMLPERGHDHRERGGQSVVVAADAVTGGDRCGGFRRRGPERPVAPVQLVGGVYGFPASGLMPT